MVHKNHTVHPTVCTKMGVDDLWEQGGCFQVEQDGTVCFLECRGGRVGRVVRCVGTDRPHPSSWLPVRNLQVGSLSLSWW